MSCFGQLAASRDRKHVCAAELTLLPFLPLPGKELPSGSYSPLAWVPAELTGQPEEKTQRGPAYS